VKLRLDQWGGHLSKGAFAPLYLLFGDELLLQIEAVDALRAAAMKKGYGEREVFTVEQHFKWDDLIATQDNLSLFASQKFTEIRVPTGRFGVEGGERMLALAQAAADSDIIVATFPKLDKTQQGSAWFAAWAERGVVVETPLIEREQLGAWLVARLRAQNQSADDDAIHFLVEHCEGNLVAAAQEVKKLALVCPQPTLARADIEEAIVNVARYTIEQLSDAFLRADLPRFTQVLDGLKSEGEALPPIIWRLNDDVHTLARVMTHLRGGASASQAVRNARVWGKRVESIEFAVARVRAAVIPALVRDFAELDAASKGLRPHVNGWSALTRTAMTLAGHDIREQN
jgi:DNA polymerase III subunit delta